MKKYISDVVDMSGVDRGKFNLIVSPCGSGKTYFCANTLTDYYRDVLPGEILFVTSRSLAANQLVRDSDVSERFDIGDTFLKRAWMGKDDLSYLNTKGLQVTTYDKVIKLLLTDGYDALFGVKILIFDECHALFSDRFIRGMDFLCYWIHVAVKTQSHLVFGLTATPGIIYANSRQWCTEINELCDTGDLDGYKAKNLWIVDFTAFPEFYNKELKNNGKTIIMCDSIRSTANVLYNSIYGSKLLVSKSGSSDGKTCYNPADMDYIREAIITRGVLPDDVKVLVATGTIREGFSFVEKSGVRNVVCCFTDEMSITQLMGRCRYDIDNLVIIKKDNIYDSAGYVPYIKFQHDLFDRFEAGVGEEWFEGICDLVKCGVNDIQRFSSDKISLHKVTKKYEDRRKDTPTIASRSAKNQMKKYIYNTYIVKPGMSKDDMSKRLIDSGNKQDIVDKAVELGLFGEETGMLSCNRIINICAKEMGFEVDRSHKRRENGKFVRYTILKEVQNANKQT